MKILVIDYGLGNQRSVVNAIRLLGVDVLVSQRLEDLSGVDRIVLPGVGAFGDGITNLRALGWDRVLNKAVFEQHIPFLGICLGMQMLATVGTEHGFHDGLNWLAGRVDRLTPESDTLRVPHIGWNDVAFKDADPMYKGVPPSSCFYFVHSFVFKPEAQEVISGTFNYGGKWVASLRHNNIWATQFHPEKSQRAGLQVLRNFLASC
ncbi:MAG: imidazole glycerol phosphate synthase, glutamine amidotransferase subunit [Lentisphaerae bacterium GWF2_57_35]|nr:MAG: imidazole glycerol phosphate synthase, glutamine amidotransferase subunit [Lentisphaerae bacterium GWF2_57_35]